MEFTTCGAGETRALGAALAAVLRSGDTLLLEGDLGAGKSELARGIARGLGYTCPVPSPTFTILNEYEGGRLKLHHFDFYRLSGPEELYESGLQEYIGAEGVTLIEWGEVALEALPEDCLVCTLTPLGEEKRRITLRERGGFRPLDWTFWKAGGEGGKPCSLSGVQTESAEGSLGKETDKA